jgi:hypothetical protein
MRRDILKILHKRGRVFVSDSNDDAWESGLVQRLLSDTTLLVKDGIYGFDVFKKRVDINLNWRYDLCQQ